MNDRELLELAAKAAGMDGCVVDYSDRTVFLEDGKPASVEWNPLTDDGDALRLAVRLRIDIDFGAHNTVTAWSSCNHEGDLSGDPDDATRRAIVRAAAEIGKGQA